ncbi:MAG: glycosyl hydrolase family 18 protein [Roseburia sp.]|nr:glycosyl hydrolase family 18 protein [Roseburia sp.]
MKKRITVAVVVIVILAVLAGVGVVIFKKFAPSFTQRPMSEQYKLGTDEMLLIINGKPVEERGRIINGTVYVSVSAAAEWMNERIYWDKKENILSLAASSGLISVSPDNASYTVGRETINAENQVLFLDGDTPYISMDFVNQYSRINYEEKREPNRIIVQSDFEGTHTCAKLADDVRLRVGPNKKYDYLLELEEGQEVIVDTSEKVENEYQKILTLDGIEGYVPKEYLTEEEDKAWTTEKPEDIFPQIAVEGKVCLGWHQMTGIVGSAELEAKISQAGSLNIISPTWFALSDNKGNFTSLASSEYVAAAHAKGLKVWGLVNDFSDKISLKKIMGRTSVRANLINNLVTTAMKYDLDGINIDFEKITKASAPGYLEFLRELVLRCHANDIVVSVDDYIPTESSEFYNWREQGRVVDYVIFMAYDEHYAGGGESGSVSSLPFVRDGLQRGLEYIPGERVVAALPFYTRLWKETKKNGEIEVTSSAYGMSSAESVLQSSQVSPEWDDTLGQYYAEFKADDGTYKIWLEEETSLEKKLETVLSTDAAGVAFWKLGFERPATWNTIARYVQK